MKNRNLNKRLVIISTTFFLLVAGGASYLYLQNDSDAKSNWVDGINYSPPTEEEQGAGDQARQSAAEREERSKQAEKEAVQTGSKKEVPVVITDAGQYNGVVEVRSFVPEHKEDGTCKIIFQRSGHSFTKDMPAKKDVSSTVCLDPQLSRSSFPSAGDWQVRVIYESKNAVGESEKRKVTIE